MATITEALIFAQVRHQAGQLVVAEQIYRQILAVNPRQPEALHLLGVVEYQKGETQSAIECISQAIAVDGSQFTYHNNLGEAFRVRGDISAAMSCYRLALELNPESIEAHNNLGLVLLEQGKPSEAIVHFRRAIELQPELAQAHNNLGLAWMDLGNHVEAAVCYRRAIELKPDFAKAHNNLGFAFLQLGRLDEAIACYRRAVAVNPEQPEAHFQQAVVWHRQGRPTEAAASYRAVLNLQPDHFRAHYGLGNALLELGDVGAAILCFRRVLELKPDFAQAHNNLGLALLEQGHVGEAVTLYRRALELDPTLAEVHNNLGNALTDQGKIEEAIPSHLRSVTLKPDFAEAGSNLILTLLYHPGYDAQAIQAEQQRWSRRHAEPLAKSIAPHANDRSPARRLRIGYVSGDFCNHVVGRNLLPLFREHDRREFEVFCYSQVRRRDDMTDRLQGFTDGWRNLPGLADETVAQMIRDDRIDILVDLSLHTALNRLLVFARKPAPVQFTFAGYPGTTGISAIDYRLTDPYLDPPGLFDHFYSEESIRLPDTWWCYDPLDSQPEVNSLPAGDRGYTTFGCLNNYCKVNPPTMRMWARILRELPDSQLLLMTPAGSARQQVLKLFAEEGVQVTRIAFVTRQPRPQYLANYHRIDIGLDTLPYNGHTTSLDSYWMGVPVVTLVGETVVGRAGLSQLTNLGLPELIAQTPDQFVQIAVKLARDLPRLAMLRATLRERIQNSPLMDAPRFARGIEAAYRCMWQRWCQT